MGTITLICPPNAQTHFDDEFTMGWFPTKTVGLPGIHAAVVGTHGPGVRTPSAAAVSDAVLGFARLMHKPKGRMFMNGLASMMLATGLFSTIVRFNGGTIIEDGAAPCVQLRVSP